MQLDVLLMAGGIPQPGDLLYEAAHGHPKALIDIAGKPMGQWVVDALSASDKVRQIFLVGLQAEDGITSDKVTAYLPDHGKLLTNLISGIEHIESVASDTEYVLGCTADIPTLTTPIVDAILEEWEQQYFPSHMDMYYYTVPRTVMEQRFPGAGRSYLRMREGDFAGADLHIAAPHIIHTHRHLWNALLNERKHALRQAARLGLVFLIKLLLHRVSIPDVEAQVAARWGFRVKGVPLAYAEAGMDVDKPHQLAICTRDLLQHEGAAS